MCTFYVPRYVRRLIQERTTGRPPMENVPRTFQRQSFPEPYIELGLSNMNNATSSVSSQPPSYDEVMKKDSKVMIHIESDPEPPSYFEALGGKNVSQ